MELLIKEEFLNDLYKTLESAKNDVLMQFMTFEGDETGLKLANKLIELKKKKIKIKVSIDYYTNYWVSDTFYLNPKVRKEVKETRLMIYRMKKAGIKIIRTRPYGFLGRCFLSRNHKKIIIIDNKAYLGGINISDHNKEWFDFMIKIDNKKIVNSIKKDFLNTEKGKASNLSENNIYTSEKLGNKYHELINNAKKEIIISSPYILDYSLLKILKNNKAKKSIFTLQKNNLPVINWMSKFLINKILELKTEIKFYKYFSHAKFLLVDNKYLLIGSSNFGKDSFSTKDEICLLIDNKEFIKEFKNKMIKKTKLIKAKKQKITLFSRIITYITYYLLLIYPKIVSKGGKLLEK